ncbi:hypothetical protein P8452_62420 [Trifolium repens]|nr:hypothetical protein P8452_62420 [Trifolium repens]
MDELLILRQVTSRVRFFSYQILYIVTRFSPSANLSLVIFLCASSLSVWFLYVLLIEISWCAHWFGLSPLAAAGIFGLWT